MKSLRHFIMSNHQLWEMLALSLTIGMVVIIPIYWLAGADYKMLESNIFMLLPSLLFALLLHSYSKKLRAKEQNSKEID
jgi:hypothetical protein